jgi:hypothetical protein
VKRDIPGVHVDTNTEVLVEVVLLLARICERDIAERDNGRRELLDVLKVESELLGTFDLLNETCRLHLVDDLLLGLGLLDQVGICTGGRDELCLLALLRASGKEDSLLMWAISSCCLAYAFIWLVSFSPLVRT